MPRRRRALLLTIACSIASACWSVVPPGTPEPCTGAKEVVVDNRTNMVLDIFLERRILGSANPGRTVLSLPSSASERTSYIARDPDGQYVWPEYVRFRFQCAQ